jgi:LPXTG-motif cell wall-anchored protein
VGVLLIDEATKPDEPSGMWGTPAIIVAIIAILLLAVLILLIFRRKRKA